MLKLVSSLKKPNNFYIDGLLIYLFWYQPQAGISEPTKHAMEQWGKDRQGFRGNGGFPHRCGRESHPTKGNRGTHQRHTENG